jgi:hypothetical protein
MLLRSRLYKKAMVFREKAGFKNFAKPCNLLDERRAVERSTCSTRRQLNAEQFFIKIFFHASSVQHCLTVL